VAGGAAVAEPATLARWTMIPYLLFADIQNTALSAFLIFSERVLYPTYATVPRLWGISVLDDQAAAGAIMWVPGSVIFLLPVAVLAIRLLNAPPIRSAASKKANYAAVEVE
jgi:cytochrome c oxidase assembly factor CtaG